MEHLPFGQGKIPQQQKLEDGTLFPTVLLAQSPSQDENGIGSFLNSIQQHRDSLTKLFQKSGALLFRGFPVKNASDFNAVVEAFGWEEQPYLGPASRNRIVGKVYTANEAPLHQPIHAHHEMATFEEFPRKIIFFCEVAPPVGGQTAVVLSHKITQRMEREYPELVTKLEKEGMIYSRTVPREDDPNSILRGWQTYFQARDKEAAENKKKTGTHCVGTKIGCHSQLQRFSPTKCSIKSCLLCVPLFLEAVIGNDNQDENGDVILCVRFEDQLSVRAQADLTPGDVGTVDVTEKGDRAENDPMIGLGSCPSDTVGIREINKENLLKVGGVYNYITRRLPASANTTVAYANAFVQFSAAQIWGTSALHSIWAPYVAGDAHYSAGLVWVGNSSLDQPMELMEAGWHVWPALYGDYKPRFFTSWTKDGFQTTGCFNVDCPGFVVLNGTAILGMLLPPSQYGQPSQNEIPITIQFSDANGEKRWNLVLSDALVGYWPTTLFDTLTTSASMVGYGGQVAFSGENAGEPLTKTDMGNGRYPNVNWRHSATIRKIQFYDNNGDPSVPTNNTKALAQALRPLCYDANIYQDNGFGGVFILYGGPGGDATDCIF